MNDLTPFFIATDRVHAERSRRSLEAQRFANPIVTVAFPKSRFAQGYLDICLHQSRYRPAPLYPGQYLIYTGQHRNAVAGAVMVHFISYLRFAQPWYPRLALRAIGELGGS